MNRHLKWPLDNPCLRTIVLSDPYQTLRETQHRSSCFHGSRCFSNASSQAPSLLISSLLVDLSSLVVLIVILISTRHDTTRTHAYFHICCLLSYDVRESLNRAHHETQPSAPTSHYEPPILPPAVSMLQYAVPSAPQSFPRAVFGEALSRAQDKHHSGYSIPRPPSTVSQGSSSENHRQASFGSRSIGAPGDSSLSTLAALAANAPAAATKPESSTSGEK